MLLCRTNEQVTEQWDKKEEHNNNMENSVHSKNWISLRG